MIPLAVYLLPAYVLPMTPKQRLIRFLILSAIGITLGASIAGLSLLLDKKGTGTTTANSAPSMLAAHLGGAYTLVDQDGKTRTDKDFANQYKIIYFGFASCPAICPTELQKIATAITALPKDKQAQIVPLFITIDPERDTAPVLKGYVPLFMPQMIGLTGSKEQINHVKNIFKVFASKVPDEVGDGYTMDHSSFIYVVNPNGFVDTMFKVSDTADKITAHLDTLLK